MWPSQRRRRPEAPVLVVEDDVDVRTALQLVLQHAAFPVVSAEHGADALAKLRAGLRPCLILLDSRMPVMDGRAFRKAQLADEQLREVPVVMYSADPSASSEGLQVARFLRKPLDFDDLVRVVEATHR